MYSPQLQHKHITRLYHLREYLKQHNGKRTPMTALLNEAADAYLTKKENELYKTYPHDTTS